jgi:hypothetical protein
MGEAAGDNWVTTGEAAELTGYSDAYMRWLANQGRIRAGAYETWGGEVTRHRRMRYTFWVYQHFPERSTCSDVVSQSKYTPSWQFAARVDHCYRECVFVEHHDAGCLAVCAVFGSCAGRRRTGEAGTASDGVTEL